MFFIGGSNPSLIKVIKILQETYQQVNPITGDPFAFLSDWYAVLTNNIPNIIMISVGVITLYKIIKKYS